MWTALKGEYLHMVTEGARTALRVIVVEIEGEGRVSNPGLYWEATRRNC